jgi:SAM-dependent methyltransferase
VISDSDWVNPGPLFRGMRCAARFRSSRDFLNGISVRVATGRRRIHSTATLTLYNAEGTEVLRHCARSTLEFDDGTWQRFPFASIAASGDATYCVAIETDAEYEAIALFPKPDEPAGPAAGAAAGNVELRDHYFEDLAYLLDPLLFRDDRKPPPRIPEHLERYLDRHLYECIRLKRYFFLRLVHLVDAIGRIGDHETVSHVLSVGAGAAFQEAFLAGRFPGMRVHATDTEPSRVQYPIPNLTIGHLDLLAGPGAPEYDLVFSIECLEHIDDYRTAFKNKAARVKPGKFLYISVPFATREEQQDEGLRRSAWEHAQHVTPGFAFADLEELFEENGLDVLHASNMFFCDLVHPLRALVDRFDEGTLESGAREIAKLYLLDVSDRRASNSREAEGIRFLGRKR